MAALIEAARRVRQEDQAAKAAKEVKAQQEAAEWAALSAKQLPAGTGAARARSAAPGRRPGLLRVARRSSGALRGLERAYGAPA